MLTLTGREIMADGYDKTEGVIDTLTGFDVTPFPPPRTSVTTVPYTSSERFVILVKPVSLVLIGSVAEPTAGMVMESGMVATAMSDDFKPIITGTANAGFSETLAEVVEFGGAATKAGVITTLDETAEILV